MGPRRRKKKDGSFTRDNLAALQLLLATLRESSDPCPPLKGVVGGLAKVMELIEKTRANDEDVRRITAQMDDITNKLADSIPDVTNVSNELLRALEQFERTVNEICDEAGNLAKKGLLKRFIRQNDQRAAINALLVKLDHAWRIFNSTSNVRLELTQQLILIKHQELTTEIQHLRKKLETSKYEAVAKPVSIEAGSLIADQQYRAGLLTGSLATFCLFA